MYKSKAQSYHLEIEFESFLLKGKQHLDRIKLVIGWCIPITVTKAVVSRIVPFADTAYLSSHPFPQTWIQS